MITVRDVNAVPVSELEFLYTQTFEYRGYMKMHLQLCRDAREKYGKYDFMCDVITMYNNIGGLDGWCLLQDLLYRRDGYIDLNIWVPGAKRCKGHGKTLLTFVSERYNDKKIILWASNETKTFFCNFNKQPFYIFDADEYKQNKIYKRFEFTSISG